ncbi:hypothetical protein BDZ91DRAFT_347937 [Kalaharituber pfeilii]|nr:hypothetical protein BDZ91DRAFT_347937 [Kalaharituber pfeilii]
MVPRYQSATTVQSSLLVFNNDVDDFLIPDMRLEGYISDTIQMVVHNLRKLIRVAIWNLTKRNNEGMDANLIQGMEDSGFEVPDFTPDWSKCRCHPVVLGGLLQGLNDKFGLAGICFASPNNPTSERWWTKPCESCDGRPWPLVPGGSLSATFSAFDDVVEKVNQVHERFGGSACTLFLPALQKSLYKIESEIQGFKLQIVERGLHSILGPHWNGDSRRTKIEQCVSLLEEQVLELPDGSKKTGVTSFKCLLAADLGHRAELTTTTCQETYPRDRSSFILRISKAMDGQRQTMDSNLQRSPRDLHKYSADLHNYSAFDFQYTDIVWCILHLFHFDICRHNEGMEINEGPDACCVARRLFELRISVFFITRQWVLSMSEIGHAYGRWSWCVETCGRSSTRKDKSWYGRP